jgi:hypothetical protein
MSEVGVRCNLCEGQPFMLTCHHVNGTGHTDTLAIVCVGCPRVQFFQGGCAECQDQLADCTPSSDTQVDEVADDE